MPPKAEDIRTLIKSGEAYLSGNGVPNARKNAEWLLSHTLGCNATDLYMEPRKVPLGPQIRSYKRMIERRGSREPLQHILRSTEFMALPFVSLPGVFIPRPDTERLVEIVEGQLQKTKRGEPVSVLDLCCGSGIILISLVKRMANAVGIAVDVDDAAIMLAEKNAALNEVADRMRCISEEATAYLAQAADRFDAIVCNPPYIPTDEIPSLAPEVSSHEPILSLDGGDDGLEFYRRAIPLLGRCLRRDGVIAFEIGASQARAVADLLCESGFESIAVHRDYNRMNRVVTGHLTTPADVSLREEANG